MRRSFIAAALAAAAVPTSAGAVPVGSQNACAAATAGGQGQATCRFVDAGTIGVAGVSDTGWTLSHKVKVAECKLGLWTHRVLTIVDFSGGSGPFGSQPTTIAGRTYTLTIKGNGFGVAGNRAATPGAPATAEPADVSEDATNGHGDGSICSS
jgi:hypothetical protein